MKLEGSTGRQHGVVDVVILLATVFLALATWLYLSDAANIPLWKSYISVAISVLFALAALTRHPRWAIAIRGLTGAWIIAAPHLLTFADVEPALYAYLTIGTLVTATSIPGIVSWQFSIFRRDNHGSCRHRPAGPDDPRDFREHSGGLNHVWS